MTPAEVETIVMTIRPGPVPGMAHVFRDAVLHQVGEPNRWGWNRKANGLISEDAIGFDSSLGYRVFDIIQGSTGPSPSAQWLEVAPAGGNFERPATASPGPSPAPSGGPLFPPVSDQQHREVTHRLEGLFRDLLGHGQLTTYVPAVGAGRWRAEYFRARGRGKSHDAAMFEMEVVLRRSKGLPDPTPPPPVLRGRLRPQGRGFVDAQGNPFQWAGVTAFGLPFQMLHNRAGAVAFVKWAAEAGFTIARIDFINQFLVDLKLDDARVALPLTLDLLGEHGLYAEVVALTDTGDDSWAFGFNRSEMSSVVKACADICRLHPHSIIELANERDHPTQNPALSDPQYMDSLRSRIPNFIPVSYGSSLVGQGDDPLSSRGDYITVHVHRNDPLDIEPLSQTSQQRGKPVVNDEPIGAAEPGDHRIPGSRRDNPAFFAEMGRRGKQFKVPSTFHLQDGLLADRVPGPRQRECARAFLAAYL